MYSIGLMSGTSMDGIDAALMETDGTPHVLRSIGHTHLGYSPLCRLLFKAAEYAVRFFEGNTELAAQSFDQCLNNFFEHALALPQSEWEQYRNDFLEILAHHLNDDGYRNFLLSLDNIIKLSTHLHIQAVQQLLTELNILSSEIDVIGYHGQCLYHQPSHQVSVIVGDAQMLADAFNIQVVNDFRRNDIANGGQGAPFAPLYHQALAIRDHMIPMAVVNCGGISNVTFIMGKNESDLMAFDIGPGNALMDQLMRKRTQGAEHYDRNGINGLQGKVNEEVLAQLLTQAVLKNNANYLPMPPPKSLDYGDLKLIDAIETLSLPDACRTLAAFTAQTIVDSLNWCDDSIPMRWVLAGGGWENPVILSEFEQRLKKRCECSTSLLGSASNLLISKADQIGWENQALEAEIFAYFAVRSLHQLPLSFPKTTGVNRPLTGGRISIPNG